MALPGKQTEVPEAVRRWSKGAEMASSARNYWLSQSEEQTQRLRPLRGRGRKLWKLSPDGSQIYSPLCDYSRARDAMFEATDTSWSPWRGAFERQAEGPSGDPAASWTTFRTRS